MLSQNSIESYKIQSDSTEATNMIINNERYNEKINLHNNMNEKDDLKI